MTYGSMLGITDYVVMSATLLLCVMIGVFFGRRDKSDSVASYLLADRRMSFIPVGFSLMATIMSALAMSGGIGEMYMYGIQYQFITLFASLGKIVLAFTILPVFHQIQYVSIYEYLEKRYDKPMRVMFSVLYLFSNIIYLGVVLYIPALSLTTVTGIPFLVTSTVTGVICVIYCVAGGYRAVIWTDVLQTVLMFMCFFLITIKGMMNAGGLYEATVQTYNGGRLHIDFVEDGTNRYSIWGLAINGFVMSIKNFSTNQAGIQRFLSVENMKVARNSMYVSIGLTIFLKFLLIFSGFAIYNQFKDCDPMSDPSTNVTNLDQILVYAIAVMLSGFPGLAGIAISGILSGSLSTLSSYINAFAALTLEDYLKPLFPNFTKDENRNIIICKSLTGFYGLLAILTSFVMPNLGGAIKIYSTFVTAAYGPLCGVMLLGMFVPRSNTKSTKIAMGFALVMMTWLVIGALMNPVKYSVLPMSVDGCPANRNETGFEGQTPVTTKPPPIIASEKGSFSIYKISFLWYSPIGVTLTVLVGYLLSFFVGDRNQIPDSRLLSPLLHSKNQSDTLQKNNENENQELENLSPPVTVT